MTSTLSLLLLLHLSAAPLVPPTLATVEIRSSLERALWAQSPQEGRALAAEVARLLRWRGDINRSVQRGDKLSVIFLPSKPPHEPELLAMRYQGSVLSLEAYRFVGSDNIARYYDATGTRIEPIMLNAPVPHYEQITEVVQRGRGRRRHRGDDLKAPIGATVTLPFAGQVSRINWSKRSNGLCIEVRLDAGYIAHFLHLSHIEPSVRFGAHLPAGTKIGAVGNTGHSNGPHLHYELLRKQQPVEPLAVHGRRQGHLQGTELQHFALQRDAMRRQLLGP